MKLKVAEALCQLHGRCAFVAPELFRIEDDALRFEAEVPPGLEAKAEKAAKTCPEGAIELEE